MVADHADINDKHAITIKGLEVLFDIKFPSVSGACDMCNTPVSGFAIRKGICKNRFCNNQSLDLKFLPKKWFWAKFLVTDINNDDQKRVVFGTHQFTENILKILTNGIVTNVDDYIKLCDDNTKYNSIMQKVKTIVIDATIIVNRRKNADNFNDENDNIAIQIDNYKKV